MIRVRIKFHNPCYPLLKVFFSRLTEISFEVEDRDLFGSNMECKVKGYIENQAHCDFSQTGRWNCAVSV